MAVKLIKTEEDERARSRFHVNMIMGERWVLIVDNKWKKLTGMVRSMKLDVDETISESTYEEIFTEVVELTRKKVHSVFLIGVEGVLKSLLHGML